MICRNAAPLCAALAACAAAPARSQTPADTVSLVRATAEGIGEQVRAVRRQGPVFLGEPTADFDRWVALRLEEAHRLPLLDATAPSADWFVTRGADFRGDTAAVTVERGTRRPEPDPVGTCVTTMRFLFARDGGGWTLVRIQEVSQAVVGMVRG